MPIRTESLAALADAQRDAARREAERQHEEMIALLKKRGFVHDRVHTTVDRRRLSPLDPHPQLILSAGFLAHREEYRKKDKKGGSFLRMSASAPSLDQKLTQQKARQKSTADSVYGRLQQLVGDVHSEAVAEVHEMAKSFDERTIFVSSHLPPLPRPTSPRVRLSPCVFAADRRSAPAPVCRATM
jgi:hypothetical protein